MTEKEVTEFPVCEEDVPALAQWDMPMVDAIYRYLGCKDPLTRRFIQVALTCIMIFDHKQQEYGKANINRLGKRGVATRIGEKADRLINVFNRMDKGIAPKGDSIEDSFGDAANYGMIGLMVRWGWWPD